MQWRLVASGVVLVVGCGTPIAVSQVQTEIHYQAQQAADFADANQLSLARDLPASPPDVVWALVKLIDDNAPDDACRLFTTIAITQLDATLHATTCAAAIGILNQQVTDPGTYINALTVPPGSWSINGDIAFINGCAATWDDVLFGDPPTTPPGPLPGRLDLTRVDNYGWQITHYQPC